jgi:hypothetical protein
MRTDPATETSVSARPTDAAPQALTRAVTAMTGVGLLTVIVGLVLFVAGIWPLVFNNARPNAQQVDDAINNMILGLIGVGWGALICVGASQMQEPTSYNWAVVGTIFAIPFLAGTYALIVLLDPKVKARYEEMVGTLDQSEDN